MENFNTPDNPEFTSELRKLQTTDKAHADVFNSLFETLINNDVYLNKIADTVISKTNITHNATDSNPEKVPGADVTANLQEQITAQNSEISNIDSKFNGRNSVDYIEGNAHSYSNVFAKQIRLNDLVGTLKITLPVSWTSTMFALDISFFNYKANGSTKIWLSGYNYKVAENYQQITAKVTNNETIKKIRFTHDGSKCCILIGDTTSIWQYPCVSINNVLTMFTDQEKWQNGYDFSLITDESNINTNKTITVLQ